MLRCRLCRQNKNTNVDVGWPSYRNENMYKILSVIYIICAWECDPEAKNYQIQTSSFVKFSFSNVVLSKWLQFWECEAEEVS